MVGSLEEIRSRINVFFQTKTGFLTQVLVRYGAQPKDYDDIVQEAWIKTYNAASKYDPNKSAMLSSWIYTILKNTVADYRRKRSYHSLDEFFEDTNYEPSVDPIPAFDEIDDLRTTFKIIMNRLPMKHRTIIRDRFFKGKSYLQISQELGVKESTVRGKFHEAMNAFKDAAALYRSKLLKTGILLCKCGCGTELAAVDDKGKKREEAYARGHWRRHNARKYSEERISCHCGCGHSIYRYDRHGTERFYFRSHGGQKLGSKVRKKYSGETRERRLVQSKLALRQVYKQKALRAGVVPEKTIIKTCTKCQLEKECKFSGHFNADTTPRYNNWCVDCMREYARNKTKFYRDSKKAKANCA